MKIVLNILWETSQCHPSPSDVDDGEDIYDDYEDGAN